MVPRTDWDIASFSVVNMRKKYPVSRTCRKSIEAKKQNDGPKAKNMPVLCHNPILKSINIINLYILYRYHVLVKKLPNRVTTYHPNHPLTLLLLVEVMSCLCDIIAVCQTGFKFVWQIHPWRQHHSHLAIHWWTMQHSVHRSFFLLNHCLETAAVGLCSFQLVREKLWITSTSAGQNADKSLRGADLGLFQSYQRYKQISTANPTCSGYTSKRCEVSNKDDEEQQKPTNIVRLKHSFSTDSRFDSGSSLNQRTHKM